MHKVTVELKEMLVPRDQPEDKVPRVAKEFKVQGGLKVILEHKVLKALLVFKELPVSKVLTVLKELKVHKVLKEK